MVLLFVLVASAQATSPGGLTVTDLLERCRTLENPGESGTTGPIPQTGSDGAYCLGHIEGFRETLMLSVDLHKKAGCMKDWKNMIRICIPRNQVTSQSLALIFTHWARTNRERADEPATIGIYEALRQAYPCVDTYR